MIIEPFFACFLRDTAPLLMLHTKTKQCNNLHSARPCCGSSCNNDHELDNAGLRLTWLHGSDNRGMCVLLQLTGRVYCQAGTQESPLVQSIAQLTGIHKLGSLTNLCPARHCGHPNQLAHMQRRKQRSRLPITYYVAVLSAIRRECQI